VYLEPRESQRVTFALSTDSLAYFDTNLIRAVDDGDYHFRVGIEGECERYLAAATAAGLRGQTDAAVECHTSIFLSDGGRIPGPHDDDDAPLRLLHLYLTRIINHTPSRILPGLLTIAFFAGLFTQCLFSVLRFCLCRVARKHRLEDNDEAKERLVDESIVNSTDPGRLAMFHDRKPILQSLKLQPSGTRPGAAGHYFEYPSRSLSREGIALDDEWREYLAPSAGGGTDLYPECTVHPPRPMDASASALDQLTRSNQDLQASLRLIEHRMASMEASMYGMHGSQSMGHLPHATCSSPSLGPIGCGSALRHQVEQHTRTRPLAHALGR